LVARSDHLVVVPAHAGTQSNRRFWVPALRYAPAGTTN
jgi:hypothetical protein